jgi:acetyl esterase/lipase
MFRWLLFLRSLALFALGLLTTFPTPDWSAWQLALLAGEFGHWLAAATLFLAAVLWWVRGDYPTQAVVAVVLCVGAAGLFLKPAFQAARIGASLPDTLTAHFGPQPVSAAPFSFRKLFLGEAIAPVPVQRLNVTPELPLDFYRAIQPGGGRPAACVIVVHGGGWDNGARTQLPELNHWLARRGYAVAAISYRLAPQHQWPTPRDDLRAALAFLKARAAELSIDSTRLVLLGRSAGGQIALTSAYTLNDPAIRGVIGLYAPSDLVFGYANTHENDMLKSPQLMRQYLGGTPESARANYESASAYFHVGPKTPPTLLVHGTNDTLVWYRHSERLASRLTESGIAHAHISLPWATHAFDYSLNGPGGQLTTFALAWFLAAVTK